MTPRRIPLHPEDALLVAEDPFNAEGYVTAVRVPTLTVWPAPSVSANGTGVIVCPGGGYEVLAVEHEGAEIASWLNRLGVTAFVLRYRVPRPGHPAPLRDILRAIRLVRSRSAQFGVTPDRVGVLGSSAGGHLAACAGTLYNDPEGREGDALDAVNARPDFLVLLYPVIALGGPHAHAGSRRALLGENPSPQLLEKLSPDLRVAARTPPSFLVHAEDDTVVPLENSRNFSAALKAAGVPAELTVYPEGFHGFGLGAAKSAAAGWPQACEHWLRAHGWLSGVGCVLAAQRGATSAPSAE